MYLQLPGTLTTVTCGRFAQDAGVGRFVYRQRYLEDRRAVELDRFELPLRPGTFETARLGGIFGALRDAAPDSWGRRIIERALKRTELTEVDYLLNSPEDRAGALSFGVAAEPPALVQGFNRVVRLKELLAEADRIERNLPLSEPSASLLQPGTSLGGARPKSVVEDDRGLWVAKFPSRSDRWNATAVEAATLDLAEKCGLQVPPRRLVTIGRRVVLLVLRFDRERRAKGYLRHRMVSGLTVLGADDEVIERAHWSYLLLADELKRWAVQPADDLRGLFDRLTFNALISNTDDHPRNHALIADRKGWRLSPAYDLNPIPSISRDHRDLAMVAGDRGRWANRENLLSRCARFGLTPKEASARVSLMKKTIDVSWRRCLTARKVSKADIDAVAPAFDYPGFEYQ